VTYSSYLLHVPVQLTIATVASYARLSIPIYSDAFFLCFIAGMLLLSFYCYRYFEMPAQSYVRRRFRRGYAPVPLGDAGLTGAQRSIARGNEP
jgi:peptidoglycan/LPS O-acetylase OafA/YrhL